jgi:ABC-type sugar transport system ATPase subunit
VGISRPQGRDWLASGVGLAGVTLDQVTKVYRDGTAAVSELGLDIADGEFMVLVGPSGCGKTTALRMVAGLETITEGHVRIGDRVVTGWRRKTATSPWSSRTTRSTRT